MATFQLAGLPSMQVANQNAPGQPSLSNYDFSQRPNVGVQLAQGLGAVGQEIQQNEAAQKLSDFQKLSVRLMRQVIATPCVNLQPPIQTRLKQFVRAWVLLMLIAIRRWAICLHD